jgi:SAM-dependent methyltransferase
MQGDGMHIEMQQMKVHNRNGGHRLSTACVIIALLACLHAPVCADLVGHWTFDDTAVDAVGAADGVLVGSPAYETGKFGKALRLENSDHVILGDTTHLNFGSATDFTAALWIKTNGWSSDPAIISNKNWNSGSFTGWVVACGSGTGSWQWNYCGDSEVRVDYDPSGPVIDDSVWHHLCVTHERDGFAMFYVDGELQEQLDISTSTGSIDSGFPTVIGQDGTTTYGADFSLSVDDVRIYNHAISQAEINDLYENGTPVDPDPVTIEVNPYVQFSGSFTAVVRWDTNIASSSIVEYGTTDELGLSAQNLSPVISHEVTLDNLDYRMKYYYRISSGAGGNKVFSDIHTFDNALNYARVDCSGTASPYPDDSLTPVYQTAADEIIAQSGITTGYCLVYGCGQGRLAFELARRSNMIIVGVDTIAVDTETAINKLMEAGVYGARVKIRKVDSLDNLPFTKYFFNLIVSDRMISDSQCVGSAAEMFRVLRPSGGVAFVGQPSGSLQQADLEEWLDDASLVYTATGDSNGLWAKVVKSPLPGAAEWPRQYGNPDNAAYCGEDLEGATQTGQLRVQWIGSPGADFGADRNPRMPTPVMANGRLYHMGLNRIVAVDSYNGAIYWSLEIPNSMRVNTPRDSGYFSADDNGLFIAVDDDCWRLDGDTGLRTFTYKLNDEGYEWGYVARAGDKLYGSAQYKNAHYTNIWGGGGWYDNRSSTGATAKICSRYLFADNESTGARVWTYDSTDADKGVIINATITIGNGRVYFVESRNATVESYPSGRIGISQLWDQQYLVALDQDTGVRLWQQSISPVDGVPVFYLVYARQTLILVSSSSANSTYYLYAYDAGSGNAKAAWAANPVGHSWTSDNHGGHIQHPVVVGNRLYLEPRGYNIDTGADLGITMGSRSGCSTRAGTTGALIYRGSGRRLAMWDINSGSASYWSTLRPSCWLSTIPAGGMVLSPEGGGGCSCNEWFQTSIGFVHK